MNVYEIDPTTDERWEVFLQEPSAGIDLSQSGLVASPMQNVRVYSNGLYNLATGRSADQRHTVL